MTRWSSVCVCVWMLYLCITRAGDSHRRAVSTHGNGDDDTGDDNNDKSNATNSNNGVTSLPKKLKCRLAAKAKLDEYTLVDHVG